MAPGSALHLRLCPWLRAGPCCIARGSLGACLALQKADWAAKALAGPSAVVEHRRYLQAAGVQELPGDTHASAGSAASRDGSQALGIPSASCLKLAEGCPRSTAGLGWALPCPPLMELSMYKEGKDE